jgi:hypothetical protein
VVAVVALAILAVLLILHYTGAQGSEEHGVDHTPAIASSGQDEARLVVSGGTDRLTVIAGDVGDDLVRAETPATQRAVPVLQETTAGTVSVITRADDADGGGGTDLSVRLARDVRWEIAIDGGSSLLSLDLREGRVRALDVTQGVATIEAALPRPDGVLNARIGGGAGTIRVVVPDGVPAQATFSGGAGGAVLDGVRHGGIGAGTTLATTEPVSSDRIELALDSGIGQLELRHQG